MNKERICCVCRTKKPAKDLIRVARISENGGYRFVVDKAGNANGRGAHLCPECIEKAVKVRALNRSFKGNVGNEIYEELLASVTTNKQL